MIGSGILYILTLSIITIIGILVAYYKFRSVIMVVALCVIHLLGVIGGEQIGYDYKYVGDGYAPVIECKTIVISNSGFVCFNQKGETTYKDTEFKSDSIFIVDSTEWNLMMSVHHVEFNDNIINYISSQNLPDMEKSFLYIPDNIEIINLSSLSINKY